VFFLKLSSQGVILFSYPWRECCNFPASFGEALKARVQIKQESFIGTTCIEARKSGDPLPENENIYGPLIALPRVGKEGE